jgi:hydroxyquinol 1,2-dioxygenase
MRTPLPTPCWSASGRRPTPHAQISEALVRHLHAFVREVEPSQEEWRAGIEFLTRTGHMCDDKRQEFILLSDALGVSMLVDAINNRLPAGATETTVLGPFYVRAPGAPARGRHLGGHAGQAALLRRLRSPRRRHPDPGRHRGRLARGRRRALRRASRLDALGDLAGRARFRTDAEGPLPLLDRSPVLLSDPPRRAGGRAPRRPGTPSLPARPTCTS